MRLSMTIFIILFMFPLVGLADVVGRGFIEGWGHMMNFGYRGMFMWLVLAVIVLVIIYFINSLKFNESFGRFNKSSLDIIKERYAKGEINEEEFERMKKNLNS